jgi:NAD(P)-dependent dehydrogenase (short-subunit alcohol dehydrogenase family)
MTQRAALVTGGSRRIGRTLALRLAERGFTVAVHHRASPDEAEAVAAEIAALGGRVVTVDAELSDPKDVAGLIPRAAQALATPLTLLINNASLFLDDRIGGITDAQWDLQLDVNLKAPVFLAQAFAAQAPEGADAQVINLIDQRVLKQNPQFFSYSISKAGLFHATRMLAQALAPRVRVNAVGPGPTLPSIHQSAETFAAEAAATLLGKRATPEDIAQAVLYLVDATAVTGQMIAVDAGQHLLWRTPDIQHD